MTDESPPPGKIAFDQLADELQAPSRRRRAITILLTVGILTFGVMLGAHLMAADLLFGRRLPPLQPRYIAVMKAGTAVSGAALVVAAALNTTPVSDE